MIQKKVQVYIDDSNREIMGWKKTGGVKKGNIPWNKGIPMREESKRKLSITNTGKSLSKEHIESISKSHLGKKNHFYGKHHTKISRKLMSDSQNFFNKSNPERIRGKHIIDDPIAFRFRLFCNKFNKLVRCRKNMKGIPSHNKGKSMSEIQKLKISISNKGKKRTQNTKELIRKSRTGAKATIEARVNQSKAMIKHYEDHPEALKRLREIRAETVIPYRDSKPERMMQLALTLEGIKFQKHKAFKIGKTYHQVDIFVEPNICLEVDGWKWHSTIQKIKRDNEIDAGLNESRNHVIRVTDTSVLKDAGKVAKNIIYLIKQIQNGTLKFEKLQ
jgi:very-short-patch-repair endonuclease